MTDANAARRERAEWWIENRCERGNPRLCGFNIDWLHSDVIDAYLAGSREEAEIKDAEIERMKCEHAGTKVLARDLESACKTGMLRIREQDAEIETLRTTYDSLALHCTQRETLLQSLIALRNEQTTEIAALREAVRDIDSFIGTSAENQLREWHRWEKLPAVRRAREKKP